MKRRLYIAAVNTRYGRNVFLPLTAGLLWSYARQFPEITNAYALAGILYLKEPIADALARLDRPDVLALSSYIWSHEWNRAFARAVKEKWPECTTIVGGIQVPDESPRILEENPQFDFAIYGEGEGAFADFLKIHASADRNYNNVGSLIWVGAECSDGPLVHVNPRRVETPIDTIPSPYLEGVFDDIVKEGKQRGYTWNLLQETNRGCPYH